ncbi:MAG: AEC family transporter [Ruminococcaceae bacterium]|nr:AEC family transporter [Oscillospiraceae bacterium]
MVIESLKIPQVRITDFSAKKIIPSVDISPFVEYNKQRKEVHKSVLIQNFVTVSMQALSLFIMMALGLLLFKAKLFRRESLDDVTNILLWAVTPCLLINSFTRRFERSLAISLGVFAAAAALSMTLIALVMLFLLRRKNADDRRVMTFATTFSNCGFMGLPLAEALYGEEGVMYASIFVAVFNLVQWTLGYCIMSGKGAPIKRVLINPGIIGLVLGLPIFIFSLNLPDVLHSTISAVAGVNTPLAMIVIGAHLACGDIVGAIKDKRVLTVCAMRLLVMPLAFMGILALFGTHGIFSIWWMPAKLAASVLLIELAAPCGATTVLIGSLCGRDTELAGQCVALSTLLSVATLPVIASLGEMML